MQVKFITIHCSATPPSMHNVDAEMMRKWHKAKGWSDIGYHFVIKRDGTVEDGRPITKQGAQVRGHNKDNVGICLVGGVNESNDPEFNYTDEQINSLRYQLSELIGRYGVKLENIKGHRDWSNVAKACPCFDVREMLEQWRFKDA